MVHADARTGYIVAARHVIRRVGVRSDMAIFNDGSAGIAVAQLTDLGGGPTFYSTLVEVAKA